MLRAIAAGLFVFAGMIATVALLGISGLLEGHGLLLRAAIVAAGAVLVIAAMYLFNPKGTRWLGPDRLADLERRGLVVDTSFRATRAFGVDDDTDEGPYYFLELADGSGILALCGEYLRHYEPIDDDPEGNRPRRFPCSTFTVLRHRTGHHVVGVICGRDVLEPEVMAPQHVLEGWWRDGFRPEDGDVLTGITFDELKERRTRSS